MISNTISFKLGAKHEKKKNCKFTVLHNLPDFGLDIEAAFENWAARTDNFTIEVFCVYVVSKDPVNLKCTPDHANSVY